MSSSNTSTHSFFVFEGIDFKNLFIASLTSVTRVNIFENKSGEIKFGRKIKMMWCYK
jgi:hypothetical protein